MVMGPLEKKYGAPFLILNLPFSNYSFVFPPFVLFFSILLYACMLSISLLHREAEPVLFLAAWRHLRTKQDKINH